MTIENVYRENYLIPVECEKNFKQKSGISQIEHLALQEILAEFIIQYEEANFGCVSYDRREDLRGYIRWCEGCVDILDGCYDTYEFEGFLIKSLWMTPNDVIVMSVFEIPENCDDWMSEDYYEFPTRLIRLN